MTLLSRPPLANAATLIDAALRRELVQMAVDALQQANPHLLGVQSQHVAHGLKRKRPALVPRTDPSLRLAEKLTPVVVASAAVLVEAGRGVEQHRPQKPALSQRQAEAATRVDLCRKENLRE
jgi:hypothetical protein